MPEMLTADDDFWKWIWTFGYFLAVDRVRLWKEGKEDGRITKPILAEYLANTPRILHEYWATTGQHSVMPFTRAQRETEGETEGESDEDNSNANRSAG